MGLMGLLEAKSEFEPEPHLIKPYIELFERLEAIMVQAEKEGKRTWDVKRCKKIFADLRQAFYRAHLPERTTIWQIMLVDCCLEPLWESLDSVCDTDETQLIGAVLDTRHQIGFWKCLIECQGVAVGLLRESPSIVDGTGSQGERATVVNQSG